MPTARTRHPPGPESTGLLTARSAIIIFISVTLGIVSGLGAALGIVVVAGAAAAAAIATGLGAAGAATLSAMVALDRLVRRE